MKQNLLCGKWKFSDSEFGGEMSKKVHAVTESLLVAEMFMMTLTIVDSLVSKKSDPPRNTFLSVTMLICVFLSEALFFYYYLDVNSAELCNDIITT